MDGRCQEKTVAFAKELFGTDFIDTITEPGMDKVLAGGPHAAADDGFLPALRDWVKVKAGISANGHGSKAILITGHMQCAGNPVSYEEHLAHLRAAGELVQSWNLFGDVRLAAFGDDWELKEVPA